LDYTVKKNIPLGNVLPVDIAFFPLELDVNAGFIFGSENEIVLCKADFLTLDLLRVECEDQPDFGNHAT
jgi:hypothetical protein